ncbi:MAG TPA: 3-oxoacyl-[acyl-carrier-protein] synthase III C-terminal domain-containing protein, partial [Anaerolineales bacterium]|nr:3-oxoacyl-[acyl-carrier-protein] synthase III C-terminal domain-containing protein [Anaerolineales bacterium]
TWGESCSNAQMPSFIQSHLGQPLPEAELMELDQLGFLNRHRTPDLTEEQHLELELEVGARLVRRAAAANGWKIEDVDALLVGLSMPIVPDYVERIAVRAGMRPDALKVSVHKACDGSVGGLHLALNPALAGPGQLNIAERLHGKKVLIGGIEGLTRGLRFSRDRHALQLFGNGAGIIGMVPGQTMKFLTGKTYEVFDEDGVLAVHMYYPHSGHREPGKSTVEVSQSGTAIRVAGLMHEPEDGSSIAMSGPMGMVKLFVRSGVQVVSEVYQGYLNLMQKLGETPRIAVAIVHHANYKINKLKEKQLAGLGIKFPMPWLLSEFGNVSAASNMIAFLRQLPSLRPGDHVLIDGFGAGTYYDVLAVEMGG